MPKNPYDVRKVASVILGEPEKKKPTKVLSPSKRATLVQKYSKGRCSYCKKKFDYLNLDVHHIKERSKGGSNELTNLTILCAGCHRELKHGTIDRTKIEPIRKPKTRKRQRKRKPKTKKPTDLFQIPDIKLPKGYPW